MAAIHPLILAGEAATTAHPMWTDAPLADGQTIAFELGGCMKRYNVGLARTIHLGTPSDELRRTAAAVEEGMAAVMDSLKPGAIAGDVHAAWQRVLDRYGLEKPSRIGYSIGVGYAPDGASAPCPSALARPPLFRTMPSFTSFSACGWMTGAWSSARRSMCAATVASGCAISRSMFMSSRHERRPAPAS